MLGFVDAAKLPAFMVVASMTGFGALVNSANMGALEALMATFLIWGLPGQVAFVELFLMGAPVLSLVLAVSMANMRFLPMSLSLVPMFKGSPWGWRYRYLWTFLMSVNTWAGLMRKVPYLTVEQRAPYYFGYSVVCMLGGLGGTLLGYLLAGTLPFFVTVSLVFLNPIYFAFLFAATQSRAAALALVAGALLGPPAYMVSPDWGLPFCGLIAGTAGFLADKWLKARRT